MILILFYSQIISIVPSGIITQKKTHNGIKKETQIVRFLLLNKNFFLLTGMGHYMENQLIHLKKKFAVSRLRIESNIFGDECGFMETTKMNYLSSSSIEGRYDNIYFCFSDQPLRLFLPFKVCMD